MQSEIQSSNPNIASYAPRSATSVARVHTISVYLNDKPGVLARLSVVFARRGYNIESLIVSPSSTGGFSRMTITCSGDPATLEQIIKQLGKIVDVVHATDSTDRPVVETELALIKLDVSIDTRTHVLQIAEHFEAKVVDLCHRSMILRISGSSKKLDDFVALLQPFHILELVRTGKAVMARGSDIT